MAEIKGKMQNNLIEATSAPTIFWKKFFDKFPEIETKEVSEWDLTHVLAYFCKLYENQYGMKYTFKFNAAPSKCYEIFQLKKVCSMLSTDPAILKEYIDWVFRVKVLERKKRITVIGYLASVDMINEFKMKFLAGRTGAVIDRSSALPDNLVSILASEGINATTYGDLAFIKSMLSSDLDMDTMTKYNNAFMKLSQAGFDKSSLDRIK